MSERDDGSLGGEPCDGDAPEWDAPEWDAPEWDAPEWDESVDVICVGTAPGVAAYAMVCAAAGFDVETVRLAPAGPDPQTREYLSLMTADLDGGAPPSGVPIRARPVEIRLGRTVKLDPRDRLDPFLGERLRLWSADCLQTPSGVLFTAVPDHVLTLMRTDAGELITACMLPATGPTTDAAVSRLVAPVYQQGRIVGAVLDDGSGGRLVRADHGLAFPVGPAAAVATHRSMALVGRPAGRFARLEPLQVVEEAGANVDEARLPTLNH